MGSMAKHSLELNLNDKKWFSMAILKALKALLLVVQGMP